MSYGLIYQTQWDSIPRPGATVADTYYAKIYKKDYDGTISSLLASGKPVAHQWQTDDPHTPIKGSNFTFTFINSGLLPLSTFFSVEDNTFRMDYYWNDQLMFTGFIVQTDSTEIQIDIPHTIELSFTDNLALLKEVTLQQAASLLGPFVEYTDKLIEYNGPHIIWFYIEPMAVAIGDTLQISGSGVADGNWTVVNFVDPTPAGLPVKVQVAETLSPWVGGVPCVVRAITPFDLTIRRPFAVYLRLCLLSTSLQLNTQVYGNIHANGMPVPSYMFEDAYLDGETFFNSNTWQNCYDVLTEIMNRFKCMLIQVNGVWNILRYDEMRYTNNQPRLALYTSDFIRVGGGRLIEGLTYGNGSDIQTGLLQNAIRPYKYDKETFNYIIPQALKNQNINNVGAIISTNTVTIDSGNQNNYPYYGQYPIGSVIRTDNYQFPATSQWTHVYADEAFIVVLTQELLTGEVEKDRFVYQPKITNGLPPGYQNFANTQFNEIEVNAGDRFDFSCSIKVASSIGSGSVTVRFGFYLRDTAGHYYSLVNTAGGGNRFQWNGFSLTPIQSIGMTFQLNSPDEQVFTNYTLSDTGDQKVVPPIPADGLLTIRMYGTTDTNVSQPDVDAIWKDLNLTLTNYIAGSVKVVGQTHTQLQPGIINNKGDETLIMDDSPKNTVGGTIFLASFTNLLQDRTFRWNRSGFSDNLRLGQITTLETLYWHRKSRIKLEGNLIGLVQPFTYNISGHVVFVAPNQIVFSSLAILPIVVGSVIVVTGSISNDGTYNVTLVTPLFATPNIYTLTVAEAVVNEDTTPVNLQITTRQHLTALTVISYLLQPNMYFLFGMLSIDYKNNQANGTLYEQWDIGEVDNDLQNQYEFKYLYDTKN